MPSFWKIIVENANIFVISNVKDEIIKGGDDLSLWFLENWTSNIINTEEDINILESFRAVADYVVQNKTYQERYKESFMDGADPWIVATAKTLNYTLVSMETAVDPKSTKVKIPSVCQHFGLRCISTFDMLRELKIVL